MSAENDIQSAAAAARNFSESANEAADTAKKLEREQERLTDALKAEARQLAVLGGRLARGTADLESFNTANNLCLLSGRWQRNRKRRQHGLVDRSEIGCLLARAKKIVKSAGVSPPRDELRLNTGISQPRSEDVILECATWDLFFPDPTAAELVQIPAFIEQDISAPKQRGF